MAKKSGDSFRIFLGTRQGQAAWREILEKGKAQIRSTFVGRPDAEDLEKTLKAVWSGYQLDGYLFGVADGYSAARRILKDSYADTIERIVRSHPDLSTKQICRRMDSLGKPVPRPLLGKNAKSRSWEDAIKDRESLLTKRVEKYISRIRIEARRLSEARGWKGYLDTGMLP